MWKLSKIITICFIVFSLGVTQVNANAVNEGKKEECNCHALKHKSMLVHLDMYYELLAEKYAPDQLEQWNEIRKEREMIKKRLKEAEKRGEILHGEKLDQEWLEKHKELQIKFSAAVEKREEKEIKMLIELVFLHHKQKNELLKKRLENLSN